MRIALPAAAAALAAAIAGAVLMAPADAATAAPLPVPATGRPHLATTSKAELTDRVRDAVETDARTGGTAPLAGATVGKSPAAGSRAASGSSSATIDPKIIGGTPTSMTTAPWMAQLWYDDDRGTADEGDDIGFFCGGTVVAPTKILTAAHCVSHYNWHAHGVVLTGTAQLADTDGGTLSPVQRQWSHPSYNASTIDNDIAVLTLPDPVKAKPVPITTSNDTASYAAGTNAKVYGWGRTSSTSEDISDVLRVATVPINSSATCSGFWGGDYIAGHMVCAGKPATGSDTGTTASCNGDSGGPLIVNNKVVGVVSWGVENCVEAGAYSVFTKVSTYVGATYPRIDDANLNWDHNADLFARRSSDLTGFEYDSKGTYFKPRKSLGYWGGLNLLIQADLDRDGNQDFLIRDSSTGDVEWGHYVLRGGSWKWTWTLLFDNWKTRTRIIAPGDMTGDGLPDVLSVDSGGKLWLYPGLGNGKFSGRKQVGTSKAWNAYNMLAGHGDLSGDGRADLLARSTSGSAVYVLKGTGNAAAPLAARVKVRTWSIYNRFAAVGDITGDGKADFLARTSGGTLRLYPGTGKATSDIFGTPVTIGTGWQQYGILG
ncbi:trypsin-like serine protease [Streptomyces sp. NPDC058691]|uniref:trypsin-like serine protease n=1 Tax=Streptomyces sp. NPDC058691 TaxID=3346601 RepID=UPI00366386EB